MSVTMTNHRVIWNQTHLEGISQESLKTDFMSRRNVFQFWFIILYLRLTHTISWLSIIPYNIIEQFYTSGNGINFLSWIWGHKSVLSRRNAFWIMPVFLFGSISGILEHMNKCKAIKIYLWRGRGRKNNYERVPLLNWEMCIERVPFVTESKMFSLCLYNSCFFKLNMLLAAKIQCLHLE